MYLRERKSVRNLLLAWLISIALSLMFQELSDRTLKSRAVTTDDGPLIEGFTGCDRRIAETPCTYVLHGDNQSMVLLGDSTAGTLVQMLYQVSFEKQLNLIVFSKGGCPYRFTHSFHSIDSLCEIVNSSATKYLIAHKPKVVIISNYVKSDLDAIDSIRAAKATSNYVERVLIVGTPPKFPDGERFGRLGTMFSSFSEAPKYISSRYFSYGSEVNERYRSIALNNGFYFVNIFDLICNEIVCSRYRSGEWLYYDADHLSTAGSYLIKSRVESFIDSGGYGRLETLSP